MTPADPTDASHPVSASVGQEVTQLDTEGGGAVPALGELRPGTAVGRYVVVERVGSGGMGVVYGAWDPQLARRVALKLLHPGASAQATGQLRLLREAQALARLKHPNVVAVHDVGTHEECVFIAMEFVEGDTLVGWLRARPRPLREILGVFVGAGRGLAAAHAAGLVHRDFKPDNVRIDADGVARVLDFGLVRATDAAEEPASQGALPSVGSLSHDSALATEITRAGGIVGTPAYMAPEQFLDQPTDARTDQFAFCVCLWEAVYGERPFRANDLASLAFQVTSGKLRDPPSGRAGRAVPARIPGWLRRALVRGLSADPDRRWPAMEPLLAELAADRRRRVVVLLAALGAVATAAAVVGLDHAVATGRMRACERAGDVLDGAWSPTRAAAVRDALSADGRPFARNVADASSRALSSWAEGWRSARARACEDTQVAERATSRTLEQRYACLDAQRVRFEALADGLATPAPGTLERAVAAAHDLPGPAACLDPGAGAPRTVAAALELKLAAIEAQLDLGRPLGLEDEITAVTSAPEVVASPDARARVALLRGQWEMVRGHHEAAAQTLLRAAADADVAGRDDLRFDALALAIHELGWERSLTREARALVDLADGTLRRRGSEPRRRSVLLGERAAVAMREHAWDEADALLREALELDEALTGPDDPQVAKRKSDLGVVAFRRGAYEDALAWHRGALARLEATLGGSHPEVAATLGNLANVLTTLGRHEEAIALDERCLQIDIGNLGADHPSIADDWTNLGAALDSAGRVEESLAAHRRALEIRRAQPQVVALDVAISLESLGNSLSGLGRLTEADASLQEAARIYEAELGASAPELAACLINLGQVALGRRDPRIARRHLERAAAIAGTWKEPQQPLLAALEVNLGDVAVAQRDWAGARSHYERSQAAFVAAFGADHPDVAYALLGLGQLALRRGNARGAVEPLSRALELRQAASTNPIETAEIRAHLALALRDIDPERSRSLGREARAVVAGSSPVAERTRRVLAELPP
jgi:tetratricopeptide (TPR) repeat protein